MNPLKYIYNRFDLCVQSKNEISEILTTEKAESGHGENRESNIMWKTL
jgi:hypothetical protein